ncbi:hypothetical protein [Domibacillus indicus]|uniref:hypothetical protein n=1 Tax=Domibacillus indicus TaxID=1437523 RepID=UPI0012E0979A|nr:hypothetical protein [Domibacillus indicus]
MRIFEYSLFKKIRKLSSFFIKYAQERGKELHFYFSFLQVPHKGVRHKERSHAIDFEGPVMNFTAAMMEPGQPFCARK